MKKASKSGFALLLVMICVAAGVVMGMSYLAAASLKTTASQNHLALARARYLAESGLEHALYALRFSPDQLDGTDRRPWGPFYVDGTSDGYLISCAPDGAEPGRYTLTVTASVGSVRRTSSMSVYCSPGGSHDITRAVTVGAGLTWLPWSLTVNGDIHANGLLFNTATINGNASATDRILDPWHRITGDTDGDADSVDLPELTINQYKKYDLGAGRCKAVKYRGSDLSRNDPLADGGAVTEDNPGGVVYLKPRHGDTVTLNRDLDFTGTLIIDGDIILDGRNITLTAVQGFPAILCTGSVIVTGEARGVTINGVVAARDGLKRGNWNTSRSSTTVNGAVVSRSRGYDPVLLGSHTLNFDEDRAQIYDMSVPADQRTSQVSVVAWND